MSKIDNFSYPSPISANIWDVLFEVGPSCWDLKRVKWFGKSAVKLFLQNSNLYDHDTSTLQTDEQTTCLGNTALRYRLRAVKTESDIKWTEREDD